MPRAATPTLGVILAGGRARRMGGAQKALLTLGGETLLARIARRLAPQCEGIIVSANDPLPKPADDLPVVADIMPERLGPLAGILAALTWMERHRPDVPWLVSVPCDTPFIPDDLVSRLHAARLQSDAILAHAASGERSHHAVGLWPVGLRPALHHALVEDNVRRVFDFSARDSTAKAVWPVTPRDPFFNINTPEDLAMAEGLLRESAVEEEPS